MFGDIFGRFCGCGCGFGGLTGGKNSSCEVLWIIILLLIVFKGNCLGIDLCTLIILFIVFGKDLLCCKKEHKCC
jgi:hypothetical protein